MPVPRVGRGPARSLLWVGGGVPAQQAVRALAQAGFAAKVVHASTLAEALARVAKSPPSATILDGSDAGAPVLEAVQRLLGADPRMPVVVVVDADHVETALNAVDAGAHDWIPRERLADGPFMARLLDSAIELQRLRLELVAAGDQSKDAPTLQRQRAELEALKELNRSRTNLLNTAAHELSTPLTPVLLQVQMMRQMGPLNAEQEDSLRILDRNLARLDHLVRDILDVARLESHRLRLERSRVDLAALAADAVAAYREPARKAGVTLELLAPEKVEAWADPRRVAQVLDNLTSNAVKFTPKGGRVRVRVSQGPDEAVVSVEDTGRGLRPEDFGRLFQPFSQVHDTMQQTRAGAGLGLFICQGLIEQHGGRIWCDSPGPGKGSVFSFALPVEPGAGPAGATPTPAQPAVQARGVWPLIHFKCPECGSRDIQMRILKNRYECGACAHAWR